MDLAEYKREVENLEREVSSLDSGSTKDSEKSLMSSRLSKIMKYKPYIIVFLCTFLFLIIVQPKIILKVDVSSEQPEIVVDKKRFVIWWFGITALLSFIYSIITKKKA